jgi:hypothetical protein
MVTIALALVPGGPARPEAAQQPAAASARAIAPIELTGYWVSVVNEDWRYRMVTPQKGDYGSVPLTPEARTVAEGWDLNADNASGNQCKPFGVGNIMRQPGRLHITWQDDTTLKIETDAGTQTRLLHFGPPMAPPGDKTWQGHSVARWEGPAVRGQAQGRGGRGRGGPAPEGGSLHVDTTHFRAGYLRTNGVPYSENAIISENFDLLPTQDNGDVWLLVVTTVEDPLYLNQPFLTSTHFKREPDGSKWSPSPCSTDPLGTPTLRRR